MHHHYFGIHELPEVAHGIIYGVHIYFIRGRVKILRLHSTTNIPLVMEYKFLPMIKNFGVD